MAGNTSKRNFQLYIFLLILIFLSVIIMTWAVSIYFPPGIDFHFSFYPAWGSAMRGENPYNNEGIYNPPWIFFLSPLALLPENVAWGIFVVFGILIYLFTFIRLGAGIAEIIMLMLSPFVLYNFWHGNIDFLVFLGAALPGLWGIWFLMLKPQIGIWLVALRTVQRWKHGERRFILYELAPIITVLILWILSGWYNLPNRENLVWSVDIWPWGIIIGVPMILYAFRLNDESLALAASPFLSPYVAIHSWLGICFPFIKHRRRLMVVVIFSWIGVILRLIYQN